jgi:hypothetical protein
VKNFEKKITGPQSVNIKHPQFAFGLKIMWALPGQVASMTLDSLVRDVSAPFVHLVQR